jgi:hypothetical protein
MTSTAMPMQTAGAITEQAADAGEAGSADQAGPDPKTWRPFEDSPNNPKEKVPPGIEFIRSASGEDSWTSVSKLYGTKVFPGAPISQQATPASPKQWRIQSAGTVGSPSSTNETDSNPSDGSSSTPSTPTPQTSPRGTNLDPIHNPTKEYPNELKLPAGSGIPNFGGSFRQYAISSDGNTRWYVEWVRPGAESGKVIFVSSKRIVGDGEKDKNGKLITGPNGDLDSRFTNKANRKDVFATNGHRLFDSEGNPQFTTVKQLFFENGKAGHGTQALVNLEVAAGLTADRFMEKREVTTYEHRVLLGQSKHSGHWYVLTPNGKGGLRTYHIGENEPKDEEIREKIKGNGFSHVWARQSNRVITLNELTPEGEPGFQLKGEALRKKLKLGEGEELWINPESKDRRTKWIATLHRPGKSPQVVYTFGEKPDEKDFETNTPAFRELQKVLNPATAKDAARQKKGGLVYEDGLGEVFTEEVRTPKGLTWKMMFFPTGNKPAINIGSSSTKPEKKDFEQGGLFRDELFEAQGKKITPPILQNRIGVDIDHSGQKLKVIVFYKWGKPDFTDSEIYKKCEDNPK